MKKQTPHQLRALANYWAGMGNTVRAAELRAQANGAMICRDCGNEVEPHESGLCDSCETQEHFEAVSEDRHVAPRIGIPYAPTTVTPTGLIHTCPVCGEKCHDPLESFDEYGEQTAPSAYQNHYAEKHAEVDRAAQARTDRIAWKSERGIDA